MKTLKKVWYWVRWPLAVLVVFYSALVLYRIPAVGEQQRTQEAVAKIQAQKITLADVMGDVLPPVPNKEENDATVAGIDKNNNGIRDDVELAIFSLHASSSKISAAELQYAMALQTMITEVFNTDTWKAAANQYSRGYDCMSDTNLKKETDDLVINTDLRKQAEDSAFKFTTSVPIPDSNLCDIDLNTLPN